MPKKQEVQKEKKEIHNHYKIGQIVSLRSNALQSISEYTTISLSGEPDFITPLMVVVEVLDTKTNNIDEVTGEERFDKGRFQYKCMWFSKNNFRFETNWFHGKELLHYTEEVDDSTSSKKTKDNPKEEAEKESVKFKIGDKLVFKTNSIEINKKKLSYSSNNGKNSLSINPILSFTSPPFVFVGYAKVEKKEPEKDSKTLEQKRWYPHRMVKIKTFNKKDDKISELLVPMEVMEKVEEVDEKTKSLLIEAIENNKIPYRPKQAFVTTTKGEERFVFPEQILSLPHLLRIGVKDVFTEEKFWMNVSSIKLDKKENIVNLNENIKKQYPKFTDHSITTIEDFIKGYHDDKLRKACFKIIYKNNFDKITTRYILPNDRYAIPMKEEGKKRTEFYINSFCLLRLAERNFKVDRIISLEEVEGKVLEIAREYKENCKD